MAATKFRPLIVHKNFTHYLEIKLAKSSFPPQFETSLRRFQNDALATNIPEKALRSSDILASLFIGRLKLKSPQRREQFSKLLHRLDYSKLIGPVPESAQSPSVLVARENMDPAHSVSHVAPLRIDMSGLTTKWPDPSSIRRLYIGTVDRTGRLHTFLRSLIDVFTTAGFPILTPNTAPSLMVFDSYVTSFRTPSISVTLPDGRTRLRNKYRVPAFDVRELLKKYENEIWATDLHLEKLRLQRVGATKRNPDGKKVLDKEQPEIDSVALP